MSSVPRIELATRMALLSLAATVAVVAIKGSAAYLSGSVSVLSEALQSVMDIAMSGLAVFTVRYASRPPDRDHPYGHGKAEILSASIQMIVIVLTSLFVLLRAWERYQSPEMVQWSIGAAAMAISIAINLVIASRLARVSQETNSASLASEAIHLKSDSAMSGGVLVGMVLVGATGVLRLDPMVAAVSAFVGIYSAIRHLAALGHSLMDGSLPEREVGNLETVLNHHTEVRGYHNLRTRSVGSSRFVDLHVMLEDDLTFVRAHELAEEIEDELRQVLGGAVVSIHYEPFQAEVEHRRTHHPDPS